MRALGNRFKTAIQTMMGAGVTVDDVADVVDKNRQQHQSLTTATAATANYK